MTTPEDEEAARIASICKVVREVAEEEDGVTWEPGELEADVAVKLEVAALHVAATEVEKAQAGQDDIDRARRLADEVEAQQEATVSVALRSRKAGKKEPS